LKRSVSVAVISFKISQVFGTFAKALILSNKTAGALTNAYNFAFKSLKCGRENCKKANIQTHINKPISSKH
jgi:hypothetical protein